MDLRGLPLRKGRERGKEWEEEKGEGGAINETEWGKGEKRWKRKKGEGTPPGSCLHPPDIKS